MKKQISDRQMIFLVILTILAEFKRFFIAEIKKYKLKVIWG